MIFHTQAQKKQFGIHQLAHYSTCSPNNDMNHSTVILQPDNSAQPPPQGSSSRMHLDRYTMLNHKKDDHNPRRPYLVGTTPSRRLHHSLTLHHS
ncbi:hypothetical protein E2C01_020693 [Portunus trituberculatus]|uniref:Uncharacterized protein n=1 Tax=Portunus trituberculatus TaxID=210409 RepID=A0A5B7E0I8_PORTR|nr:hypothetical protein [Portunus trituberculatus]